MTGRIFNIQRFCTQDGPGIRTTVFLKGCPLSCAWCHNPESQSTGQSLFYNAEECIRCGACAAVCPRGAHTVTPQGHRLDRELCVSCGACAEVCPSNALEACGKTICVAEVMEIVRRDRAFYEKSGGGMTLGGGEPLMQADFAVELARQAGEEGISVAVETSGFGARADLMRLAAHTDIFLFDIKLLDEEAHIRNTGASCKPIMENLQALYESGAGILLRCPIIPGVNLNAEHFAGLRRLIEHMPRILGVDLEPYHPLGLDKTKRLGKEPSYCNPDFLDRDALASYAEALCESGIPICIL